MKRALHIFIKYQRNNRGVTAVEAAIAIPVALMIIFGVIYFALMSVMHSIAESSAHRALDLAISLPELETIPNPLPVCTDEENCDDITEDFCRGICKVKKEALSLPQNSFFKNSSGETYLAYFSDEEPPFRINIDDPSYSSELTSQQAYNDKPIIIEINYKTKSLLPFSGTLSKKAVASGYRETQSSFSYPIKVDCIGEPYDSPFYNPAKCQCKDKPADGSWQTPYGYYKGPHGEDLCRQCPKGSIPYYGDENFNFYTQHNGWNNVKNICENLAGHPEGYGCPVNGCWCPRPETCKEMMGQGGVVGNNPEWIQCGCVCSGFLGYSEVTPGKCGCADLQPQHQVMTGTSGKSIIFAPTRTSKALYYGTGCACTVIQDTDGNPVSRMLNDDDCNALFPHNAGKIIADMNGCSCRCGYGDVYNSSTQAGGPRIGCDTNIYGTSWPTNAYDPAGACQCNCLNPAMSTNGSTPCSCTQATPNATVCGTKLLANAKINPTNCECVCDETKCVNGAFDANCNCSCPYGSDANGCLPESNADE